MCLAEHAEAEVARDPERLEAVDLDGNDSLDLVMSGENRIFTALGDGSGAFNGTAMEQTAGGRLFLSNP